MGVLLPLEIFQTVQKNLVEQAQTNATKTDPVAQTKLQAISATRFTLLGSELANANTSQRVAIIKQIADQAKSMLHDVQPFTPEASNTTNPSQKPLIAEVVSITNNIATVKTPSGQEITVVTDNPSIKIRSKTITPLPLGEPQATIIPSNSPTSSSQTSALQVGTTVALVRITNGKQFAPSFILTNLPKQLSAPQPVMVVKVDEKNKTLVVSENDVPIQVNFSNKTIIKGNDTGVSVQATSL